MDWFGKDLFDKAVQYGKRKTEQLKNSIPNTFWSNNETDEAPTVIENTGTSRYINAALQALASSDHAVEQFKTVTARNDKLKLLTNILKSINTPGQKPQQISNDVNKLLRECKCELASQQDAFGLLSSVMESIFEDLLNFQNPLNVKLMSMFKKKERANKPHNFLGFSLALPQNCMDSNLTDMFDSFFKHSNIGNNPEDATWFELIGDDVPNVLMFHIQANRWDSIRGGMYKPDYKLEFDTVMQFEMPLYNKADPSDSMLKFGNYKLLAIVVHRGSINSGHYFTVRNFKENWFCMNDSSSTIIEEKDLKTMVPYLLFYQKEPEIGTVENFIPNGIAKIDESPHFNAVLQVLASSDYVVKIFSDFTRERGKLKLISRILRDINTPRIKPQLISKKALKVLEECVLYEVSRKNVSESMEYLIVTVFKDCLEFKNPLFVKLMWMFAKEECANKPQFFPGFSLVLPQECTNLNLTDMFDSYFKYSCINDDPENEIWFELIDDDVPKVLLLYIEESRWDNDINAVVIPDYSIEFGIEMEFKIPLHNKDDPRRPNLKSANYKLLAMVVHRGNYFTIRKFKGKWFRIEDSSVEPIEEAEVIKMVPYIFLYEKV